LVFIGVDMDKIVLLSRLEECLLTPKEMELGPNHWETWESYLPIDPLEDDSEPQSPS
jgi:hypothetical protein